MKKALVMGLCAGALGCGSDDSGADEIDCRASDVPTYESFGQSFVRDYCLGCHSEELTGDERGLVPVGVNFDTQMQIGDHAEAIIELTVNSEQMPYGNGKKPSDEERKRLGLWLACGAK